jgi:hypothetical protein
MLDGANGLLFVKLENILRREASTHVRLLIELLTCEPRPTSSSFLSRKAALELKPQHWPGQPELLHVYVNHWISEISQMMLPFLQNTYLRETLLDRVGALYALDISAREAR